jgi:coenzyme F420 hydrogenase subunit beta
MERDTVEKVVNSGLCTSCGICAGSCNINCISFNYGKERNIPVIDKNSCVLCGLCYDVCPGKGIELNKLSEELFAKESSIKKNTYAGHFLHAYVGHSNDENIRLHCATGGMVTQFLIWLLERGVIDGAVVVRFKKGNPLEPEPIIATTKEELWESRSSKYIVLSHDSVAKEVANGNYRNLVVVGLPCQIQGWRQLAKRNRRVRDAIKGFFSIYCSINKTKLTIPYYLQHYKIDAEKIGRFAFRDDGCMGFMKFEDLDGKVIRKIPYGDYWFGTHAFFTNPRCLMCVDQLGELADISFGDIHIKPYSDDTIGTNSIITRNSYWDGLLSDCRANNTITLDEIPIETLVSSQVYVKRYKKGAGGNAYMRIKKTLGKEIPTYDYCYSGGVSIKYYILALCQMIMYKVGKMKSLWWLIRIMDRNNK